MPEASTQTELNEARQSQKLFLTIPGVNNNCGDEEFPEAVITLSWNFGVNRSTSDDTGRPSFQDLTFTVQRGEAHTQLLSLAGKRIADPIKFVIRPAHSGTARLFEFELAGGVLHKPSGGTYSGSALEYDTWNITYEEFKGSFSEIRGGVATAPIEVSFSNKLGQYL